MFTPLARPVIDSWAVFSVGGVDGLNNSFKKAAIGAMWDHAGDDIAAAGGNVLIRTDGRYQLNLELEFGFIDGVTAPNTVSAWLANNQANREMDAIAIGVGSSKLINSGNGLYNFLFPAFAHAAGDTLTINLLKEAGPDPLNCTGFRAHVRRVS